MPEQPDPDLQLLTQAAQRDSIEELSVAVVVRHDGKVLLLRRPAVADAIEREWEIPTSATDPEDNLSTAVAAVVRTATCLPPGSVTQVLAQIDQPNGDDRKSRLLAFVVDVEVSEPIELIDHDAYTWTSLIAETPLVTETTHTVLGIYGRLNGIHTRQRHAYRPPAAAPDTQTGAP
ncbi:DNA mismatch repair protein MutT [Nocardia brasiliensis]|uniref:DNA mismatch repair protein MutT n=1 Tax=Nocardia brasiliensis TaxID=37326 RepID=UPI0024546ED9|nr:DNA mismatch repair protein MutT [Nocardia brasiliensis]